MRIPLTIAVLVVGLAACDDRPTVAGASPLPEATYMNAMADLLQLDQARRSRPSPGWAGPLPGRLSTDTAWKAIRRGESLAVLRADSAARAAVLARHGVTEAQLEATAVALAGDPKRARIVWDSIATRAQRLRTNPDSAASAGKAPAADSTPATPRPDPVSAPR